MRHGGTHQGLEGAARGEALRTYPVELLEVLEGAVREVAGRLHGRGRLVRDYAELPQVHSNPVQLTRLFVQWLVRAVRALPDEGGQLRLVIRRHDAARVRVEFHGTGHGGFAEGDTEGLSSSRELLRRLGGELKLEGAPGGGIIIHVVLPVASQAKARPYA